MAEQLKINTRLFGEIEIDKDRVITFDNGIPGFENCKKYTLIYDSDNKGKIMWLQSLDEPELAFTVMDPSHIIDNYNPMVDDELLAGLGEVESVEDYYLLNMITIPSDITKLTANLKAPIMINTRTNKASQIIVSNDEYPVKFNIYEHIKKMKEGSGC